MTIPTIKVEIQFSGTTWTDVSQWLVKGVQTRRGSSRIESPVIRYEPGHATITLNNSDRRFDPTNLSGPYVVGGVSNVSAMRPCRISATWNAISYPLFQGFIDEFDVSWVADVYSEVTVPITDAFKVLSNKKRPQTINVTYDAVGKPTFNVVKFGDGEDSGARVNRILDSAGWSATDRTISVGDSVLQGTELSGDALSELQNVAEAEVGEIYISTTGKVFFRNRHAIHQDTRSTTPQLTLGTLTTNQIPVETKLNTDDATMWNEVSLSRVGGATQTLEDSASVARNQYKTYDKSGLLLYDNISTYNYAQWIIYISKDPETRFDSLTVFPRGDATNLFPQVLTREIGDRIRLTRRPPGGGSPITRDVFIRGVEHVVSQENWVTTWQLQSAARYTSNFFILDSATNGVLNQNILSF